MKRNPILFILLAILIAQPLLSVGFGPSATTTAVQPDDVIVPAQGTRLDPGDHIDHVPILIDGTSDFVAQGWPGDGSKGNPYRIEHAAGGFPDSRRGISLPGRHEYGLIDHS